MVKGPVRKKLGEILVAGGAVTKEDIESALREQSAGEPARLGDLLVSVGKITPLQLAHALGQQHGLPFTDLPVIPSEVLDLVPLAIQQQYRMVPFKASPGAIHVAVADPADADAEAKAHLATLAGRAVKLYVAAGDEIDAIHASIEVTSGKGPSVSPVRPPAIINLPPPPPQESSESDFFLQFEPPKVAGAMAPLPADAEPVVAEAPGSKMLSTFEVILSTESQVSAGPPVSSSGSAYDLTGSVSEEPPAAAPVASSGSSVLGLISPAPSAAATVERPDPMFDARSLVTESVVAPLPDRSRARTEPATAPRKAKTGEFPSIEPAPKTGEPPKRDPKRKTGDFPKVESKAKPPEKQSVEEKPRPAPKSRPASGRAAALPTSPEREALALPDWLKPGAQAAPAPEVVKAVAKAAGVWTGALDEVPADKLLQAVVRALVERNVFTEQDVLALLDS